MKKKVLFILHNMTVGGTEKAFLNLVDTMSPDEYEVTLLLLHRWGGFLDAVPDWVRVKAIKGYNQLIREIMDPPLLIAKDYLKQGNLSRAVGIAWTHLWFKLTDNRVPYYRFILHDIQNINAHYDVAVAFAGPAHAISVYLLDHINATTKVQWIHMDVSKFSFSENTCRKLYPRFQHVFVVSEEVRQSLLRVLPEIEGITCIVPNVISARLCRQQAECGESFTDGYTGIRILTLGRLSPEKGQDIIPEVVAELVNKGVDFRWYLIGDGKLRRDIEEKVAALNVAEQVVFLGIKTNPYPYLRDSDLYVQTSHYEGRCVVIDEAKVFGLPIVTTDVAGAKEQLYGLSNSRIVERQKDKIVQAILELLRI